MFCPQYFVLSAALMYSLCSGLMLGFPAVLMSGNNTDLQTTSDQVSWIAAVNGIGGVLGSFTIPLIFDFLGRKAAHIALNLCLFLGWVIMSMATNIAALYAGRFIQGISIGYVNLIILAEYVHPRRRGYFTTLKKIVMAFGTLCCHAMAPFWTWRQISIYAATPALLAIIMTSFWPESPSFLAIKGRYSECEKSFYWIHGNTEESQRHLKLLIETQIKKTQINTRKNKRILELLRKFLMKDFQKSFLIVSVVTLAVDLCGRYYFVAYVTQILKDLLGNKTSVFYFTLGSDLIIVLALSISSIIIRYIKRRTLLFSFGVFASLLMLLISVLVYLSTVYIFSTYVKWCIALIIIFQCFIVNVGFIPVCFAVISEIFPLDHKSLGACSAGLVFTLFYALTLKLTPVLLEQINLYGTYAVYGISLAICTIVLIKIVPETKDKTLEEIGDDLQGVTRTLPENNSSMSS